MRKMIASLLVAVAGIAAAQTAPQEKPQYVVGGPLAGVPLPLFPTQHGEPPGYPGVIPGSGNTREDLAPEWDLYPGSVEHWRAYMFKYMPIRSFFDRQSQIKNFVAPKIPGAGPGTIESYAAPVYWARRHRLAVRTDKRLRPVPVVRMKVGAPVLNLDLGTLKPGLYVVRVIGAVETKDIRPFRKSLFLKATVNDGRNGEESTYRQRLGYCDEFYDVCDVYFHAPTERAYRMSLQVDRGSEVDLLVHNVSLDDVLAGAERRPIKTRALYRRKPGVKPGRSRYTRAERLARDAEIWNGFVPLNAQGGRIPSKGYGSIGGVLPGTDTMDRAQIEAKYGAWRAAKEPSVLMVNRKLNLRYTIEDLRLHRPLPDPYPFKDDGAGLVYPSPDNPAEGRAWTPVGEAVLARLRSYCLSSAPKAWLEQGDVDAAHDAAVRLIRFAYAFPSLEDCNMLTAVIHDPGAFGRGDRCRRRTTGGGQVLGHFGFQFRLSVPYDQLFDYIKDNSLLAESIGRFVPAVKKPEDLIELLDVYLVQMQAKRFLRYHYSGDGREPDFISHIAAVLGDTRVTDPWMEWLFRRVFYYPRPLAGLPDYLVSATDRDGRSTIGSSSYVMGDSSAAEIAESLELYVENGGNPKYDLRDPKRYPKSRTALYFPIRSRLAGMWTMRMGNVSGPDKNYLKAFRYLLGHDTVTGWRWTKDPRFAFILKHYTPPDKWSPEQWAEIERAAATVRRAPWMDNRSRILPNYMAALEAGLQHDDFRFRRSVMLRIGTGAGHAHHDTLDLQIHAHGLPMTVDAGQRPGYSKPGDRATRVHNTVEVDGKDWTADTGGGTNSWVRALSDMEGAHYLDAQVAPNGLARLARRQVALIAVDEGEGSQPLGPAAWGPRPEGLPRDIVTPNSYVFDVFRVGGGSVHTYCFHSNVNDPASELGDYQPKTNARDIQRLADAAAAGGRARLAAEYLKAFSGDRWFGTAPGTFEATFHLQKKRLRKGPPKRGVDRAGTESYYLAHMFDPDSPDKFTRLHLLGVEGALVMKGDLHCTRWGYYIPNIFVQRRGENLESAFAAIIEPYAGKPFLKSVRRLSLAGNEGDALRAVAVEVETTNGHTDLCFADGRPDRARDVRGAKVRARIAGEFAYYSTDADGLRQASLTGGTLLQTPEVRLRAAAAERRGRIVRVDYSERKVWIDRPWPTSRQQRILEVKTQPTDDPRAWRTGYTATSVVPEGNRTAITFLRSADFYRSRVNAVDAEERRVVCALPRPIQGSGFVRGWTASDDDLRRTWRVVGVSGGTFTLDGPIAEADLQPANALRLWEYGVGDEVRRSTFVTLRRVAPGEYELAADVDVTVTFAGGTPVRVRAEEIAAKGGVLRLRARR